MKNKNLNPLYLSICVVLLYFLWPYFINAIIAMLPFNESQSLYFTFTSNFILLIIVVAIYWKGIKKDFGNLGKDLKKYFVKSLKIFACGVILFIVANGVIYGITGYTQDNTNSMLDIFSQIRFLFLMSTLLYYPIIEELVFKRTFKGLIDNKWLFIILTGLFNALFQILLSSTSTVGLLYIIPTTIFFSTLSYIYYETDNLLIPIGYRILYNLIPNLFAITSAIIMIR